MASIKEKQFLITFCELHLWEICKENIFKWNKWENNSRTKNNMQNDFAIISVHESLQPKKKFFFVSLLI